MNVGGRKMGMQFRDLKKQYDVLKAEIDNGIKEVIETTSFISRSEERRVGKEC